MPENIPLSIKHALCLFKGLHNKTCDHICQLILLLWREFYIQVTADIEIKILRLKIKKKGCPTIVKEFDGIKGIKKVLKDLIKDNTIRKENIYDKENGEG